MPSKVHWVLPAVLAVVAAVPFVACVTRETPPPATTSPLTDDAAVLDAPAASTPPSASTAALPPTSTTSADAAVAPSSTSAEPPPPRFADVGEVCPAIHRVSVFIDANRKCTTDADCDVVYTGCGMPGTCGVGIQRTAVKELASRALAAHNDCAAKKIPLPCATCPALPPPRCGGGFCRP